MDKAQGFVLKFCHFGKYGKFIYFHSISLMIITGDLMISK
jgi:hypothetical protein